VADAQKAMADANANLDVAAGLDNRLSSGSVPAAEAGRQSRSP
jgi:hypothetical protein